MIAVTIFVAILVLLPIFVTAQEIEFNKIEKVALKVFSLKSNRSTSSLKISKAIPIYTNNEVAYYIFNFEPAGHIIVSTNKAFEPILGYGLNSTIDFDSIPLGLKFLLDNYKNEISQTKKQGLITSKVTSSKWDNYTNLDINATLQSYSTGTYLLQTTWAQDNGYNRFCPLDPNTNLRTIVGCGGVALGQILYYWQCRVFPDNSITYTPARFLSPLTVNFFGQNYNWSSMSKTSSDDYNALMLYHSAAAIRADFGSTSTTNYATNTRTALVTYFGFNANNVQYQNSYTNAEWINMLKTEINAERPIYYSGYHYSVDPNESYGHAWVIDGYNSSDLFHCNWGWSGNSNGWYSLSALNPSSYTLNDDQSAILNVYPMLDACSGLTGSNFLCSSNSSHSISVPTSAHVIWSKSNNLIQVGGNTSTTYTVSANGIQSETAFITATIYNSQNQVFITRTKDFWVGVPNAPTNISFYPYVPCLNQEVIALAIANNPTIANAHYEWSAPDPDYVSPDGSEYHFVTLPRLPYTTNIGVKGVNDCGCSSEYVKLLKVKDCGGGIPPSPAVVISPNPSSDQVEVNLTDDVAITTLMASPNTSTNTSYTITVVDSYGTIVYSETKKEKKFNIQTSSFRNGIYSVIVSNLTNTYQNKLIIQH